MKKKRCRAWRKCYVCNWRPVCSEKAGHRGDHYRPGFFCHQWNKVEIVCR